MPSNKTIKKELMTKVVLIARIVVAAILLQTLRFKFTGHPDSIYIFETVGLEPFGRIGIGILELIAGILLLFKRTAFIGALISAIILGGALVMHLSVLGIEVNEDGGLLFITAIISFIISSLIVLYYRKNIPILRKR